MIITVFKPFSANNQTFTERKYGIITNINSFEYEKKMTSIGNFTLEISLNDDMSEIKPEAILLAVDGLNNYWLVVKDKKISYKDCKITILGYDLKCYLSYRISLAIADYGYDTERGTTGGICNHFVNINMITTNDTDYRRKFVKLHLNSGNATVGRSNDTYMSRFEPINEIVQKLCEDEGQGMYWDLVGDLENDYLDFIVAKGVNRSASQNTNNIIVFSKNRLNVANVEYEISNTELKNVFYSTLENDDVSQSTTTIVTRDSTIPSGYLRKEHHMTASCNDVSDIEEYTLHSVTDMVENESFTCEVSPDSGFGTDYNLADLVTILDEDLNLQVNTRITAFKVRKSKTENSLYLTFGNKKPKLLQKIAKKGAKR